MKYTIQNLGRQIKRLHACEGGAEGLEKLLIVAALVLPLLGLLILFGDVIKEWLFESWQDVQDESGDLGNNPGF